MGTTAVNNERSEYVGRAAPAKSGRRLGNLILASVFGAIALWGGALGGAVLFRGRAAERGAELVALAVLVAAALWAAIGALRNRRQLRRRADPPEPPLATERIAGPWLLVLLALGGGALVAEDAGGTRLARWLGLAFAAVALATPALLAAHAALRLGRRRQRRANPSRGRAVGE